ncbi:unnamed protein product [Somion occarium]|uniref:MT-A70-domain-containing protein n=1 Tax=Somion occarium TaxID=3059160 RepID=A0ABP1CQI6_9APHY
MSVAAPVPSVHESLSSVNDLLASHYALLTRLRNEQKARIRDLRSLPVPALFNVATKATNDSSLSPSRSPTHSPALSLKEQRQEDPFNFPRIPSPSPSPQPAISPSDSPHPSQKQLPQLPQKPRAFRGDLPPAKRARVARYANYVPEEETIRNDYSQRYVDGGEWPQDWVLGADPDKRFEEYPKQQKLLGLKKAAVASHALPPTYLPFSQLSTLINPSQSISSAPLAQPQPLSSSASSSASPSPNSTPLPVAQASSNISLSPTSTMQTLPASIHMTPAKFDVILIDPPFSSSFTWESLQDLPIPSLAADPSFIFLWVGSGSGEGLERGREVLAKWGFRRCEDIVWVRTNHDSNKGPGTDPPTTSLLTRTKQHCLMGIRGTVRRSTDNWFVHCNVDTDVMIWEGDPTDPTLKPPEMYTLIENFCLGLRRLELFGRARTLRRGWVSVLAEGEEDRVDDDPMLIDSASISAERGDATETMAPVKWNRDHWEAQIKELSQGGKPVVPQTSEIETLRPKSPVRGGSAASNALPSNPHSHNLPNLPHNPMLPMPPMQSMSHMSQLPANPMTGMSMGGLSGNVPLGNRGGGGGGRMGGMSGMGPPPVPVQVGGGANNMLGMGGMGGMDPSLMWTSNMMPMQGGMGMNMGGMGNMQGGMGMNSMGMMGMNQQGGGGMWDANGNPLGDGMMGMGGMGGMGMNTMGGGMGGMGGMNSMSGMGGMGGGMSGMGNMGGMSGMSPNVGDMGLPVMPGMNVNPNMGSRMGMNMGMSHGHGQWS